MNSMKSDWKPGLVSQRYKENYDRIFKRIKVISNENIPLNEIWTMNLSKLDIPIPEYEWLFETPEFFDWEEMNG